jgi:hypothetical protein
MDILCYLHLYGRGDLQYCQYIYIIIIEILKEAARSKTSYLKDMDVSLLYIFLY